MLIVSSTLGWSTMTGWKRRSSAASFSMCLRYSSSVVAPMQWSSPRASIGFSRLLASMAPSAAPAPTTVWSSSMNRMICPSESVTSLRTAFSRSSNSPRYFAPAIERAQVERHDPLLAQPVGHVAAHDALGEALGDGGLADSRLADEDRVVLRPAAEHLDDATDLLVASDDRVQLALAGGLGQVAAVFLEGLVGRLGVLVRHAMAPSDLSERFQGGGRRHPGLLHDPRRRRVPGFERGEEQVLGRDVLVAHPFGNGVRIGQDAPRLVRELQLRVTGDLRQLCELLPKAVGHGAGLDADAVEHGRHDAVGLLGEDEEQVRDLQLGVALRLGELLRADDRLGGASG